jgi:pimeloyl-ACP methyl ester carboxylesterase
MIYLYVALGILAFLIVLYFVFGYVFVLMFFKRKNKPVKFKNDLSSKIDFSPDMDWLPQAEAVSFLDGGVSCKGMMIKENGSHRYLISVHGYRGSYASHTKMVHRMASSLKANSLMLILRGDKESSYPYCSLGNLESEDLLRWIKHIKETDKEATFYLYGVSMGAATVIFAADGYDSSVKGVIADSGFSSIKDEMLYEIRFKTGFLASFLLLSARLFYRLRFHEKMDEHTDKALTNCKTPFFFIHGEKDTFVPVMNMKHPLDIRKSKELDSSWLIKDCPHAIGDFVVPDEFFKKADSFFSGLD